MSQGHIEQIKSRISPSTLISKYVQLKNKGNGEFLGLCPFHEEKTPSFTVSDKKGFYHCFGCGANGDIFTFLTNHNGMNYRDALEQLASEAGVVLPKQAAQDPQKSEKFAQFFKLFEKVSKFYHQNLYGKDGAEALSYLKNRGLSDETISEFNLGYAPYNDDLLLRILKSDFDENTILESKIILKGSNLYSQFRGRVIFPINDRQGRVIAFGGRTLGNTTSAKYINSMENPIFHKGDILYNMHRAMQHCFKSKEIIVVEGYMDVISLSNAGIGNVVAPLGANVRAEQLLQLWNFSDNPTVCLDSDRAGQAASIRLAHAVLPYLSAGKSIKFCELNSVKDPDEMIKKAGTLGMREALSNAKPLVDLLFETELKKQSGFTPETRLSLENNLMTIAQTIKNSALSKLYQKFFREKLFQTFSYKNHYLSKKMAEKSDLNKKLSSSIFEIMSIRSPEITSVLAGCILFPEIIEDKKISEILERLEIDSNELSNIRDFLVAISEEIDIIRSHSLEDEIKTKFNFVLDKKRLDPMLCLDSTSASDVKIHVIRAGNLHNLTCIAKQIKEMEALLKQKEDAVLFDKLIYLKEQELLLLKEINFN